MTLLSHANFYSLQADDTTDSGNIEDELSLAVYLDHHAELVDHRVRFLVNANVNSALLHEEWDDIVEYAKRYLNLVGDDYKVIRWKLFDSPDSSKWTNILAVVELLFCLPVSRTSILSVEAHQGRETYISWRRLT